MSCLWRPLHWLLAALVLPAGMAWAQLPSSSELAAALEASAPQARQNGLAWRTGLLWVEALRQRSPLVAAHRKGVCHIGYSAYTPGQDFRWLFPALDPAQRAVWLAGVVQHELAHCAEQAAASVAGQTLTTTAWQQEVLADLAFALHVDQAGHDNTALVALLATLRSNQAAVDPGHDTSAALQCYLRQRASFQPHGAWLDRLRAWRTRCSAPQDGPPGPAPDDTAAAWATTARCSSTAPPQPMSALR